MRMHYGVSDESKSGGIACLTIPHVGSETLGLVITLQGAFALCFTS